VDDLLSEKEQIDRMRAWWSEYGLYVIGGVVLGAAILFGLNYYQTAQVRAQEEASAIYDALTEKVANGDLDGAEVTAAELAAAHGNSSYAAQSKLAMARLYMDKNRDLDAAEQLQSLLAMDGLEHFKHIGRVRLAKVLLYQDKPEEVLTMLDGMNNDAFKARYAEARGDAYVALGRIADARQSYQAALQEQIPTVDQGLVQLKLLDLPEDEIAVEAPETPSDTEVSGAEPAATDDAGEDGDE
jgi:predicted negative regulator of RcsB-dependent stress response